jgi:hypothetical protein
MFVLFKKVMYILKGGKSYTVASVWILSGFDDPDSFWFVLIFFDKLFIFFIFIGKDMICFGYIIEGIFMFDVCEIIK